jgi:hypothetical protein
VKLDEKRKVIEVLLCAAQAPDATFAAMTTYKAERELGGGIVHGHDVAWREARRDLPLLGASHGDVCLEAAYRLIESSPTLIREWFGRR